MIKTFKGKHTHTFSSLTHQLQQPGEFYESCAIQNYQGNIDLEIFINYYLVNKTVLFSTEIKVFLCVFLFLGLIKYAKHTSKEERIRYVLSQLKILNIYTRYVICTFCKKECHL